MRHCGTFTVILCIHLCEAGPFPSWSSHDIHPDTSFKTYAIVDLKVLHGRRRQDITSTHDQDDVITITFDHLNRSYILDMKHNRHVVAEGAVLRYQKNGSHVRERNSLADGDRCLYTGSVRGYDASSAAISICEGINGVVSVSGRTLFLSPGPAGRHVVYLERDLWRHEQPHDRTAEPAARAAAGRLASRHRRKRDVPAVLGPSRASWRSRYLELVLVMDHKVYLDHGSDLKTVQRRAKQIANVVHSLYAQLDVFVALVGVDVWTDADEIALSTSGDDTLTNFLHYRRERLASELPNDNAQLLTGTKFEGGVVGKALRGGMCTYKYSGGVNTDHSKQVSLVAVTVAHEMGHNFGLEHDSEDCQCDDERCIMSATSSSVGPTRWSSCSRSQLALSFKRGLDHCLRNKPAGPLFDAPVCGNGFVEPDEECDCGLPSECSTPCCDPATCRLRTNGTCATGACCDLQTCQLRPAGEPCRPAPGECDLPEYCTGRSELCPADVHRQDGLPCRAGQAYCYAGGCSTRDDQCRLLWGRTGSNSASQCYEQNVEGTHLGNCGYSRLNDSYHRCKPSDVLCGTLHCAHLNERLEYGVESAAELSVSFIKLDGQVLPCRSAVIDLGLRQRDPGLVPQGAACGSGKMCVDQRCASVATVTAGGCPSGCSGRGVCNSRGHCHCDYGWAPPLCAEAGVGGSVDSGPNLQSTAGRTAAVVLFVIFLGVVPAVALVLCCLYCRRHRLSPGQLLRLPACCRLPVASHLSSKLSSAGGGRPAPAARSVRRPEVPRDLAGKTDSYNVRLVMLTGEDELLQPTGAARPPDQRLVCEVKPMVKADGTARKAQPNERLVSAKVSPKKEAKVPVSAVQSPRTTFGMLTKRPATAGGAPGDQTAKLAADSSSRRTTFGMTALGKKSGEDSKQPGGDRKLDAREPTPKPVSAAAAARTAFLSGEAGKPPGSAAAAGPPLARVVTGRVRSAAGALEKRADPAPPAPPAIDAKEPQPTRAVPGQVRFAAGTLDRKPSTPPPAPPSVPPLAAQAGAAPEPVRSAPTSRSSTLESDRSDVSRPAGGEREGALGSTLSRVASVFRRAERPPEEAPRSPATGLHSSQSFKAAKLDRDTVRTLGISHPIPQPAVGQFGTLPARSSGRRPPVRAASDVARPVSLLVRPTEPPPRPPGVPELYDDCNTDRPAGGGATPTENIYCTIDEAPEERPRPVSMLEPGNVYQNTGERRAPWRSVSTRQPIVAFAGPGAVKQAAFTAPAGASINLSPLAKQSGASGPTPRQAPGTAVSTKHPTLSSPSGKQPSAASPASKSAKSATVSAPSTKQSPGPWSSLNQPSVTVPSAELSSKVAPSPKQPLTASTVGKQLASSATKPSTPAASVKEPPTYASPAKQTASSATSTKLPSTTTALIKQPATAASSKMAKQPASCASSKLPFVSKDTAKEPAASMTSVTQTPASSTVSKRNTSAPSAKRSTTSTQSAKQPAGSAPSSKQPTLSAASSRQSMSSVSSSTASTPSSEDTTAVATKKKPVGSVGKKSGAALSKKAVAEKMEPTSKPTAAGPVGKKAGASLAKKAGSAAAQRVASPTPGEASPKGVSTVPKASVGASKGGPAGTKAAPAAAKSAGTTTGGKTAASGGVKSRSAGAARLAAGTATAGSGGRPPARTASGPAGRAAGAAAKADSTPSSRPGPRS
ncbi:uncharacterized protein LOC119098008 [Pollicipes pollicipes]|uniref:uncharacterized protein LOC119098008 n=1 Tax=Pollicipes pollicipes TaxID=41117 RepID=UPI001884C025|nr:uncharacterized protein LOC119098008 [Pollicipes pollicipes]